jgi:tripartite ATP-independent transporter DctP family solute receptor
VGKLNRGLAILLLSCFITVLTPLHADQGILLRCADVHGFGYPTIEGIRYLDALVQKRTSGRIRIKVYPESSLGSEESVLDMVRLGALDMGRISITQAAEVDSEIGVFILPYLFANDAHKWKVLDGPIGAELLKGLERYGMIGLCFQESGYRSFYNSKRPIYRPEDLKGLKLRVQPSQTMVKLLEFLGAAPIPIDYGEVLDALEANVIDGAENNIPSYYTSGHYRFAKYFSSDRHSSIPEVLIISKKTWLKLTPADRKILAATAKESVAYQRYQWAEFEANCRAKLEKAGCRFNEVDIAAFKKAVEPFDHDQRKRYQKLIQEIDRAK